MPAPSERRTRPGPARRAGRVRDARSAPAPPGREADHRAGCRDAGVVARHLRFRLDAPPAAVGNLPCDLARGLAGTGRAGTGRRGPAWRLGGRRTAMAGAGGPAGRRPGRVRCPLNDRNRHSAELSLWRQQPHDHVVSPGPAARPAPPRHREPRSETRQPQSLRGAGHDHEACIKARAGPGWWGGTDAPAASGRLAKIYRTRLAASVSDADQLSGRGTRR
jgi:hypothetical protein